MVKVKVSPGLTVVLLSVFWMIGRGTTVTLSLLLFVFGSLRFKLSILVLLTMDLLAVLASLLLGFLMLNLPFAPAAHIP